jgi:sialic acid synthase SpsE
MVNINGRKIGLNEELYIIAEMACAHDGDINKAISLIDSAVDASADAVQLQFFSPDDLVTPDHDVYSLLHRICFNAKEWREIHEYALKRGIHVFACTYDEPSVKLAIELGVDGIKLNSSDLSNPTLLKLVARSGIPFTLGTGASTFEEIAQAVDTSLSFGGDQLIIMHGVQNFPTAIENAHVAKINLLRNVFPFPVGYQDHTDASHPFSKVIDLIAIGAGACVIEKHITLDRSEKGTDYQAALEPKEFRKFVLQIRLASKAFGLSTLQPLSESDLNYRRFQKKSIVAKRELEAGHIITGKDVLFLRASRNGLSPSEMYRIEGRPVSRTISAFEPITLGDVGNGSANDM